MIIFILLFFLGCHRVVSFCLKWRNERNMFYMGWLELFEWSADVVCWCELIDESCRASLYTMNAMVKVMDPLYRFRWSLRLAFNFVLYVFSIKNIKLIFFYNFNMLISEINIYMYIYIYIYIFSSKNLFKKISYTTILNTFLIFTPWDVMNIFLLVNVSYTSIYPFVC